MMNAECDTTMEELKNFLNAKPVYLQETKFSMKFPDEYVTLCSWKFPDGFTFQQKLYHYVNGDNMFRLGLCPTCGKRCRFKSFGRGYFEYCSKSCIYTKERSEKCKETKLERYGDSNYNNIEKAKRTCIDRYGVENVSLVESISEQKSETRRNRTSDEKAATREKIARTWAAKTDDDINRHIESIRQGKLEKYGDVNFSNPQKTKDTKLERYGTPTYVNPEKMVATKRAKALYADPNIISFNTDGCVVRRCDNPSCDRCYEKCYTTFTRLHYDRIRLGCITCTKLNPIDRHTSGGENELYEYVREVYGGTIVKNDRSVLGGQELDIYLPDKKLAFEFNGLYWHSDLYKDKNYHFEKSKSCMEKGVRLVHIWEDDWRYRRDIVENLISGLLGKHNTYINARKCSVEKVDAKTARAFCDKYHIQGYVNCAVRYGLFYNGELVMVSLFGKRRRICGGVPKENAWELYRMCSVFGTRVRGGASRLLVHFINDVRPNSIVTFADSCLSDGGVYEKMGFVKDGIVPPSYYWVVGIERVPRYRFQKSMLDECNDNCDLTEDEVMRSRGCLKIWDAGKIRYIIDIS